ncbi:IclR family transcriptional regulator [Rhodococcus sp. SGAir0479]|uniref:IclR family transcriptional regulator n=1 Tax=Rhodococcus sp. SGAir0479 TaxID=2567884 RepID=UPI0010CD3271|nr:IclR family transcriptional regulator [Rhodococcus sp. SGAir0479]QCQ93110.1 IclR family transcriptional regulator [Rhodococcus sp. SGAir0479]
MNSVLTALRVFEEVARTREAGLSELSKRLDVPKSTVQRCLKTLAEAGWLRPAVNDSGKWVITGRAFSLGSMLAAGDDLRDVALPVLSTLQAETGETVHLTVPDGDELVLIERLDSAHQLRAFLPLGTRLPLHAASNGKAYLASLPDAEVERVLAADLVPATGRTVTDPHALREEIAEIRRRGYAVTDQELHDGIAAVAVALRGRNGLVRGCFSVSGPASRLTPDLYGAYGEKALAARTEIERLLS